MHGPPEMRNPTALTRGRASKADQLGSLITSESKADPQNLQAAKLNQRFGVAWPTARLIAFHAYGRAAS